MSTDYTSTLNRLFGDFDRLHDLVSAVTGLGELSARAEAVDIDIPGLALPLLGYQTVAVQYALTARRVIVGDQMGLGKTPTGIAALLANKAFPAIVVCPPSLTINWQRELARFAPSLRTVILAGQKAVLPADDADVFIIGDAVLTHWLKALKALHPQALVVDESHRFKDNSAKRTRALIGLSHAMPTNALRVLLTGTVITNRPKELLSQIDVLGLVESLFGSPKGFLYRYCDPRVIRVYDPKVRGYRDVTVFDGSANLGELNGVIRNSCYVRRERSIVQSQLPGKRAVLVPLRLNGDLAEYRKAERDFISFVRDTKGDAAAAKARSNEIITKLTGLKRLVGQAKINAAVDFIESIVDQDEQVIVFAWHREVTEAIAKHFNAPTIIGGDTVETKQAAVDAFQSGRAKVIVGNIEAMGVGLTLTAAAHVVFVETHWTPGQHDQAEDRADRIGQTRLVTCWYLFAGEDTIDDRLIDIINVKGEITSTVISGQAAPSRFAGRPVNDKLAGKGVQALLDSYL